MRKLITSESKLEPEIGFSRAVRVGGWLAIAGTAPIAPDGSVSSPGDVYGQTRRCLEIVLKALADAQLDISHVIRTRVMLTDIGQWREAARAHGEIFGEVRPATTFVEVSRFIDPEWLVELEVDALEI